MVKNKCYSLVIKLKNIVETQGIPDGEAFSAYFYRREYGQSYSARIEITYTN